jgi:hypothetical protein
MLFDTERSELLQLVRDAIELVRQGRPGDARLKMDRLTIRKKEIETIYGLAFEKASTRWAPIFKAELERLEARYEELSAQAAPAPSPFAEYVIGIDRAAGPDFSARQTVAMNTSGGAATLSLVDDEADEEDDAEGDDMDSPAGLIQRGFEKLLEEEDLRPEDVDDVVASFDRDSGELELTVTFKASRKLVVSVG